MRHTSSPTLIFLDIRPSTFDNSYTTTLTMPPFLVLRLQVKRIQPPKSDEPGP